VETTLKTTLLVIATLLIAGARAAAAQDATATGAAAFRTTSSLPIDSATTPFDGWMTGASVGIPGYGNKPAPELMTVGLSLTYLRPGSVGVDFALGTMPRAFSSGAGVAGARANLVLPLPLSHDVVLLPGAGVSAIGAFGSGGGVGVAGLDAGLSAIFATGSLGLRVGGTYHRFENAIGPIWLLEFGIVGLPHPKSRHRR
jgi:hypothetical protein